MKELDGRMEKGWLKGRKDDGQVNERMEKGWLKGRKVDRKDKWKNDWKEERMIVRKKGWLKGRKDDWKEERMIDR